MSIKLQRLIFTVILTLFMIVGLIFNRSTAIKIYFLSVVVMYILYFIATFLFDAKLERSQWIKDIKPKDKILSVVNVIQIVVLVLIVGVL